MTGLRNSSFSWVLIVFLSLGWGQSMSRYATFSGYIFDAESGEGLPGANVYLTGTDYGMATNIDGYFVLPTIPPGEYTLKITYLGYESIQIDIELKPGQVFKRDFELSPQPVELEAVEVTGERLERKVNIQTSRVKLNTRQLKLVPQIGEADLLRTLQSLPGVLTPTEFSTGLVIRGGNTDQNLILLDGVTVYNPSHLGGLFSNFILDAVKEADLIKGGFNAEYGDRLSAVLNIRSREGNQKRFEAKGSVSLLSVQTTLEGPVGRGAWLFSSRRTWFDQVFKGTKLYFPYYFFDLQGHVFQDISENDRASVSWYVGRDNLLWDDFNLSASWGNQTLSGNYRKLFNPRLISNWMVAKSQFDTQFDLGGGSGITSENIIDDITFRSDWTFFASQPTQFRFGLELKELSFIYESSFLDSSLFSVTQTPFEAAIYGKTKHWLSPIFMVEPGLRLTYYDNHSTRWYADPRLGVKYLLTSDRYINASLGLYHQFMMTAQDDYFPTILDQWFAIDSSTYPGSAIQYILGFEEYLFNSYRVVVEVYYKTLENMLTFVEQRSTADEQMSSEKLDDLFDEASGYAYGLELFFQKQYGRLNGWFSYTYSVARKNLHKSEYYANWDRRHALNLIGNFVLSKKWGFNLKWTFQSGQPYTPILGYYEERLPAEPEPFYHPIPGGRNALRYPLYHRLDLGATRHFKVKGLGIDLFIQVVNAYWKKNAFLYFYQFGSTTNGIDDDGDDKIDDQDEGIPQKTIVNGFPIFPSIGITIDF